MATYDVTDQTSARRVQFTGNGTAGPFAFAFQVNATSEVKVFVDTTEKTETTHYTVTLNSSTGAGTISFTTGNHPTSSQTITILGDIPLSRTSVYTSGGQFTASSLESDFDTNMFIHQQTNEEINRSLRQAEHDVISGADMTLPVKADRLGKILSFNASTGNPEVTFSVADGTTLASVSADIATLADIEDGTDATDAIQTVAGIASNVSTVASISSNVTSVASNSSNINAVAGKASLITSDFVADLNSLATTSIIADLDLLATSDFISDLNAVEAIKANVTSVADNTSNINSAVSNATNINAVAGAITNVNNVGGSIANVNTVASNLSGVTSFAERYRVGSSDPSSDNDAGDLFFNTSDNTFKFFDGSSYQAVNVTGIGNIVEDTTPQLGGNLDGQDKNITTTGAITGATLTGTLQTASQTNVTAVGALNSGSITSGFGNIDTGSSTITTTGAVSVGAFTSNGIDDNADATAITIDSSENVMISKTSTGFGTAGVELSQNGVAGKAFITRSGGEALSVNRLSSDGEIVGLYKDSSLVGSIGAFSSNLFIGSNDSGLRFEFAGLNAIVPYDVNSLSSSDGATDLGFTNSRFKDIYLSGGVNFSANSNASGMTSELLDDYEEGSWTPVFVGSSGGSATYSSQTGRYTKIGNRVCANGYIALSGNSLLGTVSISGLPYASASISTLYHSATIWINTMTNGTNFDGSFFLEGFLDHNGSTSIFLNSLKGGGSVDFLTAGDLSGTTDIMINLTYQTN